MLGAGDDRVSRRGLLPQICGQYPFRGRTGRGISIGNMKAKILAGPEASDPDLNGSRERGLEAAIRLGS